MNAPGIAFVGVADDELGVVLAARLGDGAPLQAGRISGAAAPAQSALRHLFDHFQRRHRGQRRQQRFIAVGGDVVFNSLRIDVAGILQDHLHLLLEEGKCRIEFQSLHGCVLAFERIHDVGRVGTFLRRTNALVELAFRFYRNQRPGGA